MRSRPETAIFRFMQKLLLILVLTSYLIGVCISPAVATGPAVQTIEITHIHDADHDHHHDHDEHDEEHSHTHELQVVSVGVGIPSSHNMTMTELELQTQSRVFALTVVPKRPYLSSIFRPPIA